MMTMMAKSLKRRDYLSLIIGIDSGQLNQEPRLVFKVQGQAARHQLVPVVPRHQHRQELSQAISLQQGHPVSPEPLHLRLPLKSVQRRLRRKLSETVKEAKKYDGR